MIQEVVRFKDVSSTQDTAKRFIHRHHEMAIVAQHQRRGRGRHGRAWSSPTGGLYLSLILFPGHRMMLIPFLASLSVVRLLEHYALSGIAIHWPNDVLLHDKKVCGVICEQHKDSVICGIGLNVNSIDLPPNLGNATSMIRETGRTYDLDEVLTYYIRIFNPLYQELLERGLKVAEALNYITGIGEVVEVVTRNATFTATICDVNSDWSLLVRDESGVSRTLYCQEVRRLVW
ncbi:biotin--[acetyl-CoA-carboxylase] ligase [candidate division WOR-3 bacterium]|nr:biotin--[acetyl-CoA-carboxylase] ligase [candidate division WOR-3 bacterium]